MPQECKWCGTQNSLTLVGQEGFRVGGRTGIVGWLAGGVNDLVERQLVLQVWACQKCRHVEFFLAQ